MVVAPGMIQRGTMDVHEVMHSPGMAVALAVSLAFTQFLVIGFSLLVIWLRVGPDWMRKLSLRLPALRHILLVLAAFPAMWLFSEASYALLQRVLPSMGVGDVVGVFTHWPWQAAVLIIGLGPGIGEELWCRGFLGQGLVGRYGAFLGIVFSSFFFGLIHVDPCQGAMAMLMGLWLHYTYLMTRSLCVPMLLHFLNNTVSVVLPRWELGARLDAVMTEQVPVFLLLATLPLLLMVGLALYQSRCRLTNPLGGLTDWPAVQTPPPESGQTVVSQPLSGKVLLGVVLVLVLFGLMFYFSLAGKTS